MHSRLSRHPFCPPPPLQVFTSHRPTTMDRPLLSRVTSGGCCSYSTLKAWLPILSWLPRYKLKWLQMDLLAGITVGLTTVPQALAYAEVAGLPVQASPGLCCVLRFIFWIPFSFRFNSLQIPQRLCVSPSSCSNYLVFS